MNPESPIAVFDSGLGGVSVLREAMRLMPNEDFIYFGDSINAPYGTKPKEQVRELTIAHTANFIEQGAKGVLIACNTATSAAVAKLRTMYPDYPLVGIEPAVKPASITHPGGNILVLATPMTVAEKKLSHLISEYSSESKITALACPGLMEFVERGETSGENLENFLNDLLRDYIGAVDAVVLGCTHYPFVEGAISKVMGPGVEIFDGGLGTAREMKRRLDAASLLNPDTSRTGTITYINSDDSSEKRKIFDHLLNL